MADIASTPKSGYYAVIFTSVLAGDKGYKEMAEKMLAMAARQEGFLGAETARGEDGLVITVSYWANIEAIMRWREQGEHREARGRGHSEWYKEFRVRICKVEREYGSGGD